MRKSNKIGGLNLNKNLIRYLYKKIIMVQDLNMLFFSITVYLVEANNLPLVVELQGTNK